MTLRVSYSKDLEVKSDREAVDRTFFNRRFKPLFEDMQVMDAKINEFGETEATLVQLGLDRLDETLSPLLTTLGEAAELGFLVCQATGTSESLVVGQHFDVNVTDGGELFTPTPYLLAIDNNDSTNWGIVSLDQWTKETGDLATICVYASKTQVSTSWSISCNSALPAAMADLLTEAQTASSAAVAAEASVASQIVDLQALVDAVQAGPVASVAGKTGVVVLNQSDITGLVSTIAALATTAWVTTQLAGKQATSAKLDSIAGMTWANNKILYASGVSTIGTLDISEFMKTVFDDASAGAVLTTLGVSAFAQTLLDDADASAVLSTLGVSTFIKTLLDDTSSAAALTTLGAAAASSVPAKAAGSDVSTGTDDTKYVTSLSLDTYYARKLMQLAAAQSANFTLDSTFSGKLVPWTKSTAGTITLSNAAPVGFNALISCEGAGQITFAAQAGGSVQSRGARLKSNGQYSVITAIVYSNSGTNAAWRLAGDLTT
jgi:hypothetical protein